jgi:hypothetical protein
MATTRKLVISLDGDERVALVRLAERERRDPRAQAALMIRRELEREGLLPAEAQFQSVEQQRENGQNAER